MHWRPYQSQFRALLRHVSCEIILTQFTATEIEHEDLLAECIQQTQLNYLQCFHRPIHKFYFEMSYFGLVFKHVLKTKKIIATYLTCTIDFKTQGRE